MEIITSANRYHDISCGHRVVGHESKCRHLHGHNYRFHFDVRALDGLDTVGRVLDFSVIKKILCMWLEEEWDHKTLIWENDPKLSALFEIFRDSIYIVTFNPTAENMAEWFIMKSEQLLEGTGCYLHSVKIEETRKCSVIVQRV